ncbi:MAG: mechanosensitive ion channel [Bacteroidetes bacterium]|nr:mechanosensitive ion channel [Bacteroidota bacterium]
MMNPLLPFALFAASVLAGIVLRSVVIRSLLRAAKRNEFLYAETVIASVKNMIVFWSVLAGTAIALEMVNETVLWRRYADTALFVVFVLTAGIAVSRMLTGVMRMRAEETHDAAWSSSITRRLVQLGILSLAILLIMSSLGFQITTLLTVFGIGGAAFALALQDTLGNVFAGASITLGKQIRVGDHISMGTTIEGELCDIGWRNSTIRLADASCVIVPNRDLANGHVRRFTSNGATFTIEVFVQVDPRHLPSEVITTISDLLTPLATQQAVLASTIEGDVHFMSTPPPSVRLHRVNAATTTYVVSVPVDSLVRNTESRDALSLLLYTGVRETLSVHGITTVLS